MLDCKNDRSGCKSNKRKRRRNAAPIKIQCIVLGSAGAGKTSILRRYFQKTFHSTLNPHVLPPRTPTMGAFYYSQRVPNPWYLHSSSSAQNLANRNNDNVKKSEDDVDDGSSFSNSQRSRRKKKKKKASKTAEKQTKKKQNDRKRRSTEEDDPDALNQNAHVHLHMWDTAGWDTRFLLTPSDEDIVLTKSLGDSIFRYANVAMLVYDATSSRSFTQLLQWHSELQSRLFFRQQQQTTHSPFPILIVANKMDLVKNTKNDDTNTNNQYPNNSQISFRPTSIIPTVPQRDVMGLKGSFRGNTCQYDYNVHPFSSSTATANTLHQTSSLTYFGSQKTSWMTSCQNDNMNPSDQTMYLQSLIGAEDHSYPGRDMVLSWCRKNHLTHIEVSALDESYHYRRNTSTRNLTLTSCSYFGTNIDLAMETMIRLCLEYYKNHDDYSDANKRTHNHGRKNDKDKDSTAMMGYPRQQYKSFSLHERYQKKEDCSIFKCFHPWCQ